MAYAFNQLASDALRGDDESPDVLTSRLKRHRLDELATALDASGEILSSMSAEEFSDFIGSPYDPFREGELLDSREVLVIGLRLTAIQLRGLSLMSRLTGLADALAEGLIGVGNAKALNRADGYVVGSALRQGPRYELPESRSAFARQPVLTCDDNGCAVNWR